MIATVLLFLALLAFLADMVGLPNPPRCKLLSAGLALWAGSLLAGSLHY